MYVIGLTGGIASGKSTVSNIIKDMRIPIIDADLIARTIVEPGKKAWKELVEYFGTGILHQDQTLNREKLGQMIFNDEIFRKKVNHIMHPIIVDEIKTLIRYYDNKNEKVVVIDVALLIEINITHMADAVWVVFVPLEVQIDRLMQRNGLSKEEALKRIKSQMPMEEKIKYADVIINNTGSLENTKQQVEENIKAVLSKMNI